MKAIQLSALNRLDLVEIDVPAPAPDQILIRTGATTICTSDLHDLHENPFGIEYPMVLGHEGAGTIVATGQDVSGFNVGDRVAAHPVHPCLRCDTCLRGMPHLCEDMEHFGLNMQGTFAEFFLARADRIRKIPGTLPFEIAALMEPICVCLEALHQARHGPERRLLILGDGPFGVIMARLAVREPGAQVVVAGHHDARLAFAGDADTINLRRVDDAEIELWARCDGRGFDAAILAVASPDAFRIGLEVLRPMGRMVVFAPIPGETPVNLFEVLRRELEIVGAVNDQDRLDEAMVALGGSGRDFGELVATRFELEQYMEAFTAAEQDRATTMKVAFVPCYSSTQGSGR